MAETPTLYMPDFPVQWTPQQLRAHRTEIMESRSGREQRRGVYAAAGRRRYVAKSNFLFNPDDRRALYDFFQLMRGRLTPFFFWEPAPKTISQTGTLWTMGTNGAGDTWHAMLPYKGPYQLGDVPVSATYAPFNGSNFIGVGSGTGASNATIASSMSVSPRGNTFATFRFNGFNQSASAGTAANTRIAGDQTWAAWVFLRPNDTGFEWSIASNETFQASGITFSISTGRLPYLRTNQVGASTTALCNTTVPLNTWTHVAAVRSGTNVTFYINGVAKNTVGSINNPVVSTTALLLATANGNPFHGAINDLRVYSAARTAADIADIASATPSLIFDAPASANLQGLWHMTDGKTATTFADSGPNNYTGTIVNPSDDSWVGGEDEISFTGAQGAVAVYVIRAISARERIQVRFDMDEIPESFLQSGGVYPAFDISLREVI